jgi:hypothetical protein
MLRKAITVAIMVGFGIDFGSAPALAAGYTIQSFSNVGVNFTPGIPGNSGTVGGMTYAGWMTNTVVVRGGKTAYGYSGAASLGVGKGTVCSSIEMNGTSNYVYRMFC